MTQENSAEQKKTSGGKDVYEMVLPGGEVVKTTSMFHIAAMSELIKGDIGELELQQTHQVITRKRQDYSRSMEILSNNLGKLGYDVSHDNGIVRMVYDPSLVEARRLNQKVIPCYIRADQKCDSTGCKRFPDAENPQRISEYNKTRYERLKTTLFEGIFRSVLSNVAAGQLDNLGRNLGPIAENNMPENMCYKTLFPAVSRRKMVIAIITNGARAIHRNVSVEDNKDSLMKRAAEDRTPYDRSILTACAEMGIYGLEKWRKVTKLRETLIWDFSGEGIEKAPNYAGEFLNLEAIKAKEAEKAQKLANLQGNNAQNKTSEVSVEAADEGIPEVPILEMD